MRLLDSFGIAAMMCDKEGIIQLLNNAAGALFGYDPGFLEGQSIKANAGFSELASILNNEKPQITPLRCRLLDHLYCLVRMQHVGRSVRMFTFEDITDFKDREDQQNAVLHMVAHDLNTPLSAIHSYTDLVGASGEVSDKQRHFLERIQQGVRTMTGLVRDLLDIAWIDTGQALEVDSVSVAYLVQSAADVLENHATKRNTNLQLSIAPQLPQISGDAQRLERVFINIIGNAIKYTPIGGNVSVKVEQDDADILISIQDNGIGIPTEHIPHIFNRFYRVPRDNDTASGTGLGLSIVKAIVERHHGRINVSSELDKGSTFNIYLPITQP